ncbi:MAG: leucine-rich repeat domain-containing protein [Clostridia bacterium]|nr:leucine-rich repeat domain-containing protein [Clostridia bacterium]
MKRMLSAAMALLCVLTLLCGVGCSAGEHPTAENIISYLKRTDYLDFNITQTTHDLSLKWKSSELEMTDVEILRVGTEDNELTVVDCAVTIENEIMEIVRHLRLRCKNNALGWSFKECAHINKNDWVLKLTIPETENYSIPAETFKDYDELTDIVIPDTITEIGAYAFENCSNLQRVTMSQQVTVFPTGVFRNCARLESINLSEDAELFFKECFMGCTALKLGKLPDLAIFLGSNAFADCPQLLETLKIPDVTQEILDGAFRNCTSLKKVQIGKSLFSLGSATFEGCSALSSITVSSANTFMKMEGKSLVSLKDGSVILQLQ